MSSEYILADHSCVVCESTRGHSTLAALPQGEVLCCKSCGVQSIFPPPTSEELTAAYQNFDAGEIARKEFAAYVEQARHILRADLEAAGLMTGGGLKFLDYGCGGGHFVKAAADLGVDASGIDLDEESRRFGQSRGLRIEVGDESDLKARFGDERFGAILMMHVLEHVPEPAKVLRALIERLQPGGILIVRVPDQDSVPSHLKRFLRRLGIKADE